MGKDDAKDSVKKKISEETIFNRRVNYIVIERAWKLTHKKQSIEDLYDIIGLEKNSYSRIRTGNTYNIVNLQRRWDVKESKLKKIGLSEEVMTGRRMIEVSGISVADWEDYFKARYKEESDVIFDENKRQIIIHEFRDRLNNEIKKIKVDRESESDIGKLVYFCTYEKSVDEDASDIMMRNLEKLLRDLRIKDMENCGEKRRKDVYKIMKEKCKQLSTIIQYHELNK